MSDFVPAATASRRDFLKSSTAAVVGGTLATTLAPTAVHAGGDDVLKVALIGCGGRGNGAAVNAMNAEDNVRLTVLADAFPDQINNARRVLSEQLGPKFGVTDENCFTGFDAYKQAVATDVDVVLLCTPPHFRWGTVISNNASSSPPSLMSWHACTRPTSIADVTNTNSCSTPAKSGDGTFLPSSVLRCAPESCSRIW